LQALYTCACPQAVDPHLGEFLERLQWRLRWGTL
jgi:hypothetical protein